MNVMGEIADNIKGWGKFCISAKHSHRVAKRKTTETSMVKNSLNISLQCIAAHAFCSLLVAYVSDFSNLISWHSMTHQQKKPKCFTSEMLKC